MRILIIGLTTLAVLAFVAVGGLLYGLHKYGRGLPEYQQLADYRPPVMTRVHAGDGRLMAEFARERRVFVPIEAMPRRVIKAFLSAEDKNFYSHPGVDFVSLFGAVVANLRNLGTNRRPRGASTITQQVAKNFLLTNEVSIERKVKEAILAFRIERAIPKDRILELYLNEIYLGWRSYGVAAAALNYFDKSLDALSIAEAAYLAALPKAPNNYHPTRRTKAAVDRRNWVIDQMAENGFITAVEAESAKAEPLEVRERGVTESIQADYFAEEVRRELIERYSEEALYGGGLSVRTSLDPRLQEIATRALRYGLSYYDRRHGWRGPVTTLPVEPGWGQALDTVEPPAGMLETWRLALVVVVERDAATIGFPDGMLGTLPLSELRWAREVLEDQQRGGPVRTAGQVLAKGDVVMVEPVTENEDGGSYPEGTYALRQIPDVGGGLIAIDPHTGRVLAMAGGWDYAISEFNRATQALRQPGSAFKPFVYLAGLENGFTPATRILDAPFVFDQGPGLGKWKPKNYSGEFYGPTALRVGIEKSRNLMTVRLAQTIGMEQVASVAERFGVIDDLPRQLSMSLGAGETTLLRMTTAYAMIVNGGRKITPSLIDQVQDRNGRTILRHDSRPCDGCASAYWHEGPPPRVPDQREQLVDPASAFQMTWILKGVVDRGTGRRIASLGKPLGGKTGTTNENFDAWFVGFSPDLAVGTYVGFDTPRTLGPRDTGSSVAAPIFQAFMAEALEGRPETPFRTPPGISLVRINVDSGRPARPGDENVILEAFKPGTEPSGRDTVIGGGQPAGGWSAGRTPTAAPGASGIPSVAGSGTGLY